MTTSRRAVRRSAPDSQFLHRCIVATSVVGGFTFLAIFLWYSLSVVLLLFVAVLLAILLHGLAEYLARLAHISHRVALGVVLVLLTFSGVAAGKYFAPRVALQLEELSTQLPAALDGLRSRLAEYEVGRWVLREVPRPERIVPSSPEVLSRATGVLSSTVGAVLGTLLVLIVALYFAANPNLYTTGVLRLVPFRHRPRAREILGALGYTLRRWMYGQFVAMAFVGIMTTIGLFALGVPLALTFGMLAFLLDFVPNFGPIIAAVPAVVLAFVQDATLGTYVILLYFVVQQVEGLLITPLVHQRTVSLPPVLTIAAQVTLGILAGPLGLLLATPLTAVTLVLIKMLYVEDALGDSIETPEDHLRARDLPPLPQPT